MATLIAFLLSLGVLVGSTSGNDDSSISGDKENIESASEDASSSSDGNVVVTDIGGQ